MSSVVVVEYDDTWPRQFEVLAARIWPAVRYAGAATELPLTLARA